MKKIPTYFQLFLLENNSEPKTINKKNIPLDKQVQVLIKDLYEMYIKSGEFSFKMKDKIISLTKNGASEEDIASVKELITLQQEKIDQGIDELETRILAMVADNENLSKRAEIWISEAKSLANKKIQSFMKKRQEEFISKIKTKEQISGEK